MVYPQDSQAGLIVGTTDTQQHHVDNHRVSHVKTFLGFNSIVIHRQVIAMEKGNSKSRLEENEIGPSLRCFMSNGRHILGLDDLEPTAFNPGLSFSEIVGIPLNS